MYLPSQMLHPTSEFVVLIAKAGVMAHAVMLAAEKLRQEDPFESKARGLTQRCRPACCAMWDSDAEKPSGWWAAFSSGQSLESRPCSESQPPISAPSATPTEGRREGDCARESVSPKRDDRQGVDVDIVTVHCHSRKLPWKIHFKCELISMWIKNPQSSKTFC